MTILIKNDTIQHVSIYDKEPNRSYLSREKIKYSSDLNLNNKLSTLKFEMFEFSNFEKTNKNAITSISQIGNGNFINIKEFKNIKKKNKIINYDLYIKTIRYPRFTNTQNHTISMITHHRIWNMKKINSEVILESYYLKDNIKTDIYKLDNIEEVNFEITIK